MAQVDLSQIQEVAKAAVLEICEAAHLQPDSLFVVGCSSSEVLGEKIGSATSMDVALALYEGISSALLPKKIRLATQCCEHLNRALVVSRSTMEKYDLERVNAIPQPNHAGGAFASVAYEKLPDAVLVEDLKARADAGIDIGQTLIGMHIHPVVVPLRISLQRIGNAVITCARRRPKYIGGARAIYEEKLL